MTRLLALAVLAWLFASAVCLPVCVEPRSSSDEQLVFGSRDPDDELIYWNRFVVDSAEQIYNATNSIEVPVYYGITQVSLAFPDGNRDAVETAIIGGLGTNKALLYFANKGNLDVDVNVEVYAKKSES